MSLIRSTAWSGLAAMVLAGGRFAFAVLLARQLPLSEFGRFTFTQWLVDTVFITCAVGLDGAANRYFAEHRSRPATLRAFQAWFARRAAPVIVLAALASPLAAIAFGQDLDGQQSVLQGVWSAVSATWALLTYRAMGLALFPRIAAANVAYVAVLLGGVVVLPAVTTMTLDVTMLLVIAATAVQAAVTIAPLPAGEEADPASLDRAHLRQFVVNIWIATVVAAVVWSRGELAIVRLSSSAEEVALYAVALQLAALAIIGTMPLTSAIAPHVTSLWGQGRRDEAVAVARRATDWLLLASAILGASLIAFAPEIIEVAFGEDFGVAHESLAILGLGTLGLAGSAAIQLAQLASNAKVNRNANTVGALALLAFSAVLVPWQGVIGASIGRTAVWLALGLTFLVFASRVVDPRAVSWRNVVVAAGSLAGLFAAVEALEPGLVVRAPLWILVSVGLALALRDRVSGTSLLVQAAQRARARTPRS